MYTVGDADVVNEAELQQLLLWFRCFLKCFKNVFPKTFA